MQTSRSEFGQTAVVYAKDVNRAEVESHRAKERLERAQDSLTLISRREKYTNIKIRIYDIVRKSRQLCDSWTTRAGAAVLLALTPTLITLVACHLLRLPPWSWTISIFLMLSVTGFCCILMFRPGDTRLASDLETWGRDLLSLRNQKAVMELEVSLARARFDEVQFAYQNVRRAFESRINRLRSANWQAMQGVPFENFLEDIFLEWGYQVETTKTTGDQGVDLILSKPGLRIAIQAKGYPRSTVGNSSVQEAHTGMIFYRCHRCAVITNSTFTSGARQLAAAVGCALVDGSMIPNLIEGRISL